MSDEQSNRILVNGLPPDTTYNMVESYFSRLGTLTECDVLFEKVRFGCNRTGIGQTIVAGKMKTKERALCDESISLVNLREALFTYSSRASIGKACWNNRKKVTCFASIHAELRVHLEHVTHTQLKTRNAWAFLA